MWKLNLSNATLHSSRESRGFLRKDSRRSFAEQKVEETKKTEATTTRGRKKEPLGTTTSNADPTSWYISEKLDGIRIWWNAKGEIKTSTLKPIHPPQSFLQNLPKQITLEGELWAGYNTYSKVYDITTNTKPTVDNWKGVTFNVFDAPTRNDLKYEERIDEIKKYLPSDHATARLIPTVICQGKDHLFHLFYEVLQRGGEGLILRKPKCFYNEKNTFLKVKPRDDTEVLVTGHVGKNFIECVHRSGSKFICSAGGKPLPPVDSVISVKYFAFSQTHGSPRAIEYFRPRPDVVWEEVAKKEVPFYVSYGRTSMPSCRGCGRQIEKTELRIKTTLMFVPPGCGPLPVQINFCMNYNCIQQAIKKYSQQGTDIAPFDGRVWVSKEIKKGSLPTIPGFYWTFIDKDTHTLSSVDDPAKVPLTQ